MFAFKWDCNKILPLVFDESLSYYEVLCKLTKKINDVIEKISDYDDLKEAVQELLEFEESTEETLGQYNTYISSLQNAVIDLGRNKQDNLGYIEFDYSGNVTIVGDIVNTGIMKFVNKTSEPTMKAVYNPNYKMFWLINVLTPHRWTITFTDYTDATKTNRITFDYNEGEYSNAEIEYDIS